MQAREVNFLSSSGLGVQRRLAPRRVERGELGRRLDAVASGQRLECRGGAFVQHHASRSRLLLARLLGVARAAHGAGQAAHRRQVLAQPSPKARCEALRVEDDEAVAVPVRPLAGECPRLYCGADVGAARQHRAEQLDEHAEAVPLVARRLLSASERVERAVLHHLRWVGGVSPASVDGPAGRDPLPDPVHHLHLAHRHHRRRHVELERVACSLSTRLVAEGRACLSPSVSTMPPAAGAKQQRGLVPTARVQPPVAAAKGAVFVKDSPIMPAESAWFAQ
mmetsp:Transcript_32743/g.105237  ORF Transcript_32743/g.105237 Transcript_32743/m.105237 type:complete len:279 (-) Transcript_32743:559-1395(-)